MPPHNPHKGTNPIKRLRLPPTEEDACRFLERVTYRYLNRILDEVVRLYEIAPEDAEVLRDRLVNMNLIEVVVEQEEDQEEENV